MNILFICTANRDRSRTAEIYFQNIYLQHRFRSAGTSKVLCENYGGNYLKRYMLDWADRIICMEKDHADYIISQIDKRYEPKIEILALEDTNLFMSKPLIFKLEELFKI